MKQVIYTTVKLSDIVRPVRFCDGKIRKKCEKAGALCPRCRRVTVTVEEAK